MGCGSGWWGRADLTSGGGGRSSRLRLPLVGRLDRRDVGGRDKPGHDNGGIVERTGQPWDKPGHDGRGMVDARCDGVAPFGNVQAPLRDDG